MVIQVIINPHAGRGKGKELAALIQKKLKSLAIKGEIVFSTHPQEAYKLAIQAQERGIKIILAGGGDGTIHSLLPALVYKPASLAIIPLGTANDLARNWHIPLNINQALELLVRGQPMAVDIIATKSGKFIAGAGGLGFDVAVIERALSWRRRWLGSSPFFMATFSEFFRYPLTKVSITTENWHYVGPVWQVIFTKIAHYARWVKIPASIQRDDGLMSISLIPALPKYRILSKLFLLPLQGIRSIPQSIHLTTSMITISSSPARKYHGDGELMGLTPETFQVLPKALQIIAPPLK